MPVTYAAPGYAILLKFRLLALALVLYGCAPAQLQLISNPMGAMIVENDTGKSYLAPISVAYMLTDKDQDGSGCYLVKGYTAIWQSGAAAASPKTIQLCGAGPIWHYRFERPASSPNAALDLNVQNQIIANQQRQAEFQRYLAASFIKGLTSGSSSTYVPPLIENRSAFAPTSPAAPASEPAFVVPQSRLLPRMAPDGTYVSGDKPMTLCPNGTYVAGSCALMPNGTYIGQ